MRKLGSGYVLHEPIGRGAFGQVWRGSTVDGDRPVAVKVLRGELADDPEVVARFVQERSVLLGFNDPHLVTVRDLVVEGDTLAIVMDLVNGVDLRVYLRERGMLATAPAVGLVCHVLRALTVVHAAGVVHRDLKPANVLVDVTDPDDPQARLTDFGVARLAHGPSLTRLTGMIGTPLYMAPELAHREHAQPPADVYSAGIMLYELLTGEPPFSAPHPVGLLRAHMEDAPQPIAGLPPGLWDVIARMLAKAPADRPTASAAERELTLLAMSGFEPDGDATTLLRGDVTVVTPRRASVAATPDAVLPVESPVPAGSPIPIKNSATMPEPDDPGPVGLSEAPTALASAQLPAVAMSPSSYPQPFAPQPDGSQRLGDTVDRNRPGRHGRARTTIIAGAAAVVLLGVGVGALVLTGNRGNDTASIHVGSVPTSDSPTTAVTQDLPPTPTTPAQAPTAEPSPVDAATSTAGGDSGSGGGVDSGTTAGNDRQAQVARQPAAAAPAPVRTTPAPTPTHDMPNGFAGSWSGTVSQSGSPDYTVKLSLANGNIGQNVGRASYPELGCVADLYLTDVAGSTIRVQGQLVVNSYNNCVAATLDLGLRSSSSMNYLAQVPGMSGSASAVLYR